MDRRDRAARAVTHLLRVRSARTTPLRTTALRTTPFWIGLAVFVSGSSTPLSAQNGWPSETSRGAAVVSGTNLVLASMVLAPLVFLRPLGEIDEGLSPESIRGPAVLRHVGRNLGEPVGGLALAAGMALAGSLTDNDDLRQIGVMSLKALVAAEAAVVTLKIVVGRSRPYLGTDPDRLDPFVFDRDRFSFPSGHTAGAFAVATVLARRFGPRYGWVPYLGYSLAATTGVSRVLERQHWATDVLAGAAVGLLAGRLVGLAPGSNEEGLVRRTSLGPTLGDGVGLSLKLAVR